MNDSTLQAEWDALRLKLFSEVSETEHVPGVVWTDFLSVLTTAFDYTVPDYSIYRPLRTFAVARWPLMKPLCKDETILREVTQVLRHSIAQKHQKDADALETEMELLRQLLKADHLS